MAASAALAGMRPKAREPGGGDDFDIKAARSFAWPSQESHESTESEMRMISMAATAGLAAAALAASMSLASAQTCESLWYQRNAAYKAAGYCFKTERGRAAFGNRGCAYGQSTVPLSDRQRARIAAIRRLERRLGC
jgi:hypothetical protein